MKSVNINMFIYEGMNDVTKNIYDEQYCKEFRFFIVFGSYLWRLHSTRMKPLLSNNLRKLHLQTPWWPAFFCVTYIRGPISEKLASLYVC